jgi:SAM-dependent methyltransferase
MRHYEAQKAAHDNTFKNVSRTHVNSTIQVVKYIVTWRVMKGFHRLLSASKDINFNSSILILCSGEGYEGSILMDMGFKNVTVSDISDAGVSAAKARDSRLKTIVLNAEQLEVQNNSYDIVLVQDGLHHLQSPVRGFTEMLRIAKRSVVFFEPHDSMVGRLIGTKWEKNSEAINYVFRWNKKLVEDITSSFLGQNSFDNLSFSFWHHNVVYGKIAQLLGNGNFALFCIKSLKKTLDAIACGMGNQFCAIVLKR